MGKSGWKFLNLNPSLAIEWDKVVFESDDAWLFHLYDFASFTEKAWGYKSKSFLVEEDGEIIAIFPLQIDSRRIIQSLYMGACGPAIKNKVDPGFRLTLLNHMFNHVEEIAKENNSPEVDIFLSPHTKSSFNRWGVNPLVNYYYNDISTHTWMSDLTRSEKEIFDGFSRNAKRLIKKTEGENFRIEKVKSLEEIDSYYQIHCENYARTGAQPHPKQYFVGIFNTICNKGYATIWKILDKEGNPIAYENIALFKKGAQYWTTCCRNDYLESGVNYLLQYHSMLWAKSQGALWFENGEAFPNIQDGKLRGLTDFKGKFGGELHRFFKGKREFAVRTQPRIKDRPYIRWFRYFRDKIYQELVKRSII